MPEDSLKESVEAAESMATKWQIVQIRRRRIAVGRQMEINQENSKGSVLSAMRLVTRHLTPLTKGRAVRVADMKIPRKLPW
jgi:hypothetical protein